MTVNPQCASIYEFESPEEMIASVNAGERQIYASEDTYSEFLKILDTRGSVSMFEMQALRDGTDVIWTSINARSIRSPEGEVLY